MRDSQIEVALAIRNDHGTYEVLACVLDIEAESAGRPDDGFLYTALGVRDVLYGGLGDSSAMLVSIKMKSTYLHALWYVLPEEFDLPFDGEEARLDRPVGAKNETAGAKRRGQKTVQNRIADLISQLAQDVADDPLRSKRTPIVDAFDGDACRVEDGAPEYDRAQDEWHAANKQPHGRSGRQRGNDREKPRGERDTEEDHDGEGRRKQDRGRGPEKNDSVHSRCKEGLGFRVCAIVGAYGEVGQIVRHLGAGRQCHKLLVGRRVRALKDVEAPRERGTSLRLVNQSDREDGRNKLEWQTGWVSAAPGTGQQERSPAVVDGSRMY